MKGVLLLVAAFVSVAIAAELWELWAAAFHPRLMLTELTRRNPHRTIVLGGAFFTVLGFVLGLNSG